LTRVLSGAALLVVAVAAVWFAPPLLFFAIAEVLLVLAFSEYASIARAGGLAIPAVPAGVAAALTASTFARVALGGLGVAPLDAVLMSAFVALAAITLPMWSGGKDALSLAAASIFPSLYLGLPIGAMIAVRESRGPAVLFLMMLTVFVSDSAQYYSGRAFGRRKLAERISPKKTVEGAIGGFVFGGVFLAVAGAWWLPDMPTLLRAALGVTLVALGIAGDLFESMLKRSVGVKDSSHLIPGHGGVLDRIDALLFVAPVYYVVLQHL
jgi:phosphatidate cytidylyltransferase